MNKENKFFAPDSFTGESVCLLTGTIKQHARMNISMMSELQKNEQLSLSGFSNLDRGKMASFCINRAASMIECILGLERSLFELKFQSYNIRQLTEQMKQTIENTLSCFVNLSVNCTYKLKKSSETITVDQSRLELIIYNILYYCLSTPIVDTSRKITLEIRVTESEEDYIFTVKNIDAPVSENPFDKFILSDSFDVSDEHALGGLNTASLFVAKKLAESTNYKISSKRLKNIDYYSLTISKHAPVSVVNEVVTYPAYSQILLETFSDILIAIG